MTRPQEAGYCRPMGRRDNRRSMKMRRRTRQKKLKARLAKKRGVARRQGGRRWRRQARQEESRRGQVEVAPAGARRHPWRKRPRRSCASTSTSRRGTRTRSSSSGWVTSTRCSRGRRVRGARPRPDADHARQGEGGSRADVRRPAPRGAPLPGQADRARASRRAVRAARGSARRARHRQARGRPRRHAGRRAGRGVAGSARAQLRRRRARATGAAATAWRSSTSPPAISAPPRPRRAEALVEEIGRVSPRELVFGRGDDDRRLAELVRAAHASIPRTTVADGDGAAELARALGAGGLDAAAAERAPRAVAAAGAVLRYAAATQPGVDAAGRAPRDLPPRRLAGDRRAGAPPPGADRVAARPAPRRDADRGARREPHRDGRAAAAPLAAVPVGRRRAPSAAATTRSSGWSRAHAARDAARRRARRRRRCRAPGRDARAWAWRRRAISPCWVAR